MPQSPAHNLQRQLSVSFVTHLEAQRVNTEEHQGVHVAVQAFGVQASLGTTVGSLIDEPAAPMPPANRDEGYLLAAT